MWIQHRNTIPGLKSETRGTQFLHCSASLRPGRPSKRYHRSRLNHPPQTWATRQGRPEERPTMNCAPQRETGATSSWLGVATGIGSTRRLCCAFRWMEVERKSYTKAGDSLKQSRVKTKSTLSVLGRKSAKEIDTETARDTLNNPSLRLKQVQQPLQMLFHRS
jgi:hypothetical protein